MLSSTACTPDVELRSVGTCASSSVSRTAISSSSLEQSVLSPSDVENIQKIFSSLDENRMGTLDDGIIVEKQMDKLATECFFEQ